MGDINNILATLMQKQAEAKQQSAPPPEEAAPQGPPQIAPQNPMDNGATLQTPPASNTTVNAPPAPPDPTSAAEQMKALINFQQQKEAEYTQKQQELGPVDNFIKKKVEARFSGKAGAAKAFLIDFLSGFSNNPGDVRQSLRDKAQKDYQERLHDIFSQQQADRNEFSSRGAALRQQIQLENNEAKTSTADDRNKLLQENNQGKLELGKKKSELDALREKHQNIIAEIRAQTGKELGEAKAAFYVQQAESSKIASGLPKTLIQASAMGIDPKIEKGTKEWNEALVSNISKVSQAVEKYKKASGGGGSAQLTEKAINDIADSVRLGAPMPTFGRGDRDLRVKIQNTVSEGKDYNRAAVTADYKTNVATLQAQKKQMANIESFSNTAKLNLDAFEKAAGQIKDLGNPIFNMTARAWDKYISGTPEMGKYAVFRQTALMEFSRVVNLAGASGVLSDTAKKHAEELVASGASMATISGIISAMKVDMANRKKGGMQTIKELENAIAGKGGSDEAPTAGATHVFNPQTGKIEAKQKGGK